MLRYVFFGVCVVFLYCYLFFCFVCSVGLCNSRSALMLGIMLLRVMLSLAPTFFAVPRREIACGVVAKRLVREWREVDFGVGKILRER